MNRKMKFVIALAFVGIVLLLGATAAVAASDGPWVHQPHCKTLDQTPPDVILTVMCFDQGGDINEAFLMEWSYPVKYMATYNGDSAMLVVYRPPVKEFFLQWCVGDRQGNQVIEKFSLP